MNPDLFYYRHFFPPFSNKYATTRIAYSNLRLRANGRNIVDQQLPTLLDVTCCVRLYALLDVVAQSLKPVKLFSQQLLIFLLFLDRRSVAQQCLIRLHSSSNIVGATHAHYAWFTKTYGLYPSHDTLQVPTLLGLSCCIRLHTTANMYATTPNIVAPTMLGVVASVCTQPNVGWFISVIIHL